MNELNDLYQSAERLGISPSHYSIDGQLVYAKEESLAYFVKLFDPIGKPSKTDFRDTAVYRENEPIDYTFTHLSLSEPIIQYQLFDEIGQLLFSKSLSSSSSSLRLDPLPFGYYSLQLCGAKQSYFIRLFVTPKTSYQPTSLQQHKAWGINTQLYSLRSANNWGMGDLGDLRALIEQAVKYGASFVGVNPLHAMFGAVPQWASPYSSASRRWLNYVYLDINALPEFRLSRAVQNWWKSTETQEQLAHLRQAEQVDYQGVSALKLIALEKLYRYFLTGKSAEIVQRRQDFAQFVREQGDDLIYQGLFDVLDREVHQTLQQEVNEQNIGWLGWPEKWQYVNKTQRKNLLKTHRTSVDFYVWLQWLTHCQLIELKQYCQMIGLELGLYGDLAVSVSRGGADVWCDPELYCVNASVGAPPDPLGPIGQNWNLPPMNPRELQRRGFQPWIDLLRANMQHVGVLRIDHVMGLFRLWLIPEDKTASDGVYVHYPFDAMMAVLAIESQRNQCLIVGEDLGTVPDEVRSKLFELQIFSYFVLYFEQRNGQFPHGNHYPQHAFATVGTHDVPSLQSFWHCRDLELFAQLGILQGEILAQKYAQRVEDKQALLDSLHRDGYLPPHYEGDALSMAMHDHLNLVIHQYLAESRSRLIGVQLENLLNQEVSFNLPGTGTEYPNWRNKLTLSLEQIFADSRIQHMLHTINQSRNKE
ncbi:4-alpha-glucanotransferase [Conservatibacter flavescens]|uniref:4-alpha-glucanotransferase n=1 Tax=Conservatibacter flavescens TaxID=28161 RepID=A0A2M8S5D6_9PAST|nr:4-alpha-glucanotransferase [Conservatibacter flavescens]PJG86375.1 4-alpha-glucanotransferase [Conservatibacter flavescens]